MSFTLFDIIIFTILVISSLWGCYKGIVRLVLNSVSFLIGIALAMYMYPFINEMFAKHIQNENIKMISSGILAYALSSIIFSFIMSKLASTLYQMTSNVADKILGLIGGAIRGFVISLFIFLLVTAFYSGSYKKAEDLADLVSSSLDQNKYPKWLTNSISYEYLYEAAESVKNNVPKQYFKSIKIHKSKTNSSNMNFKHIDELESLYTEDYED